MLRSIDPVSSRSTFLDVGSGVGSVVLQVAAQLNVRKAVGIELLETRADYAQVGSSFNLKPHSNLGKDRL
jgi:tRNA1(Val) A37 N6-methylase TrmN6